MSRDYLTDAQIQAELLREIRDALEDVAIEMRRYRETFELMTLTASQREYLKLEREKKDA